MHDLEARLDAWRVAMARSDALTTDDIDELEVHLWDSARALMGNGLLTEEEALHLALRRLGEPDAVATEYHKAHPERAWARRWYWMATGFLGFSVVVQGVATFSYAVGALAPDVATIPALLGTGAMGFGALAVGIRRSAGTPGGRLARALDRVSRWAIRRPITTGLVALTSLAALRSVNVAALQDVFDGTGRMAWSLAAFNVLTALVAPVGFYLLGRRIGAGADQERIEPTL